MLADFQNSFTLVFSEKFATKPMPHFPPPFRCVPTLPWCTSCVTASPVTRTAGMPSYSVKGMGMSFALTVDDDPCEIFFFFLSSPIVTYRESEATKKSKCGGCFSVPCAQIIILLYIATYLRFYSSLWSCSIGNPLMVKVNKSNQMNLYSASL